VYFLQFCHLYASVLLIQPCNFAFFFLLSSPTKNAQKENQIFPSLPLQQNAQKVNQLFNHAYQVMLVILLVQKGNFGGERKELRVFITYSPCYANRIKQERI
jgi:hypothetical protein